MAALWWNDLSGREGGSAGMEGWVLVWEPPHAGSHTPGQWTRRGTGDPFVGCGACEQLFVSPLTG